MVVSILPLSLSGARVKKRGRSIVGPIDLEIEREGFTVVIGPNGAGKTTLLRLMHGLERLSEGETNWQVPEAEARKRQAFVFQAPVMMRRSVTECIAYPLQVHGVPAKEARRQARDWAGRLGLGDLADRQASVLSGGERQKLALARALIRQPDILFLDEPCASLDGRAMREIETILSDAFERGTRVIMSTHDMGQARRLATDVIFVYKGLLHEIASAHTFFAGPQTAEAVAFLNGDIVE